MPNLAVTLESFGSSGEGVAVREVSPPRSPGVGEVLVKMVTAPINPADLNTIEGKYGTLPKLPAVLGSEGTGVVEAVGSGVEGLSAGDRVGVLCRGTWASRILVSATDVFPVSADTAPELACQLGVNPPTALLMLEKFVELIPGEWVTQNAANSGVGRSVISIAAALGLKTLNIVRRPELIPELEALGADRVVTEETDLRREGRTLTGGKPVRLALNAVGGASALNLANALADDATLVTYGAMGRQPLKIPNGLLIFRGLRFSGFWLTRWKSSAAPEERVALYRRLTTWAEQGVLRLPVHRIYPAADAPAALTEAAREKRSGKVLLQF